MGKEKAGEREEGQTDGQWVGEMERIVMSWGRKLLECTAGKFRPERENPAGVFFFFVFWFIWGGRNMPIKPGVRAVASGSFQVNPAAVCLK